MRVGLNSGQVIAGELGSESLGYTAVGDQVGLAQRMESVVLPGGVMLSVSTARLVDNAAALSDPEMVRIKGAAEAATAHRLLGISDRNRITERADSYARWPTASKYLLSSAHWTAHSVVMARWYGWWANPASARAVWCARWPRWQRYGE